MVGGGAFFANAAKPLAPMFSIQHRSAMNALSCGRCSSLIISAPGAAQSMSASAHWRSLILASMSSMSIAIGSSFGWDSLERGGPGHQADGAGVGTRDQAFDVPADLGFELRHAVQVATIVSVQAGLRHLVG